MKENVEVGFTGGEKKKRGRNEWSWAVNPGCRWFYKKGVDGGLSVPCRNLGMGRQRTDRAEGARPERR